MSNVNDLLSAKSGIEQLARDVKDQLGKNNSVNLQLSDQAVIVNNFVLQTLGTVSDNEDISEVNQILANSLLQIKDYVVARPNEVKSTIEKLESKLSAYEQSLLILDDVIESTAQQQEVANSEAIAEEEADVPEDKKKE